MINNKVFLKDVDVFIVDGEYCRPSKQFGYVDVSQIELIGLMTQWLLDKDLDIKKRTDKYEVIGDCMIIRNTSLYDCLVEAINKLGADNAN
jgi:hypothetical protein